MPGKPLQLSRRSFLAASAALAARPAAAATTPLSGPFEVVIVGAGAAGIAAARRLAAAGRRYVVIEATDHIGGRCITDTKSFGIPFDRGAHWMYLPDSNPVTKHAPVRGIDIYPAPQSQK
ncbi:MAG: NAD(P)-binding protein, partial [Xanthobacteraceae bacterium]